MVYDPPESEELLQEKLSQISQVLSKFAEIVL